MKKDYNAPILILLKNIRFSIGECHVYMLKKKGFLEWAKYWFLRRIEKEGWEADEAYIVEESEKLPLSKWRSQEEKRQEKEAEKEKERLERKEYERLKTKFEKRNK